jgi:hypothetical protein
MNEHTIQIDPQSSSQQHTIIFWRDGTRLGSLDLSGGELVFNGDADASAKVFFECVSWAFSDWVALEQEKADRLYWEACQPHGKVGEVVYMTYKTRRDAARAILPEAELAALTERGARAWPGIDPQKLREGEAP